MKPITKTTEDVVEEILERRTKPISDKLDEISTKLTSKQSKDEKVDDIIRKMKEKVPEKIVRREQEIVGEPYIDKKEHVHDDVFCPSCNKGHIHKLENSGLTMKCTDGSCGEKFYVIPEGADHTCSNCGYPIKKPVDEKIIEACPFCKNLKAIPFSNGKPVIKFDFSKMQR